MKLDKDMKKNSSKWKFWSLSKLESMFDQVIFNIERVVDKVFYYHIKDQ